MSEETCWHDTIRSRRLPSGKVRITCEDCGKKLHEYTAEELS